MVHTVIPTSQSGDWHATFTHYFYPNGKTMMFALETSASNCVCTEILRTTKTYYYDQDYNLIKNIIKYTDKCQKIYLFQKREPRIFATHKELSDYLKGSQSDEPYLR
jgi:hypothetical protein